MMEKGGVWSGVIERGGMMGNDGGETVEGCHCCCP